ncbi:hypothetical protein ACLB1T_07530 [Escherichia coli]
MLPEAPHRYTRCHWRPKSPAPLPPLEGYTFEGYAQCRWQHQHRKPISITTASAVWQA